MSLRRSLFVLAAIAACSTAGADEPLKICLLSGSAEYESDATLAKFKAHLEASYPVKCVLLKAVEDRELPGLEALSDCDLAIFFTRRLKITGEALARVKKYCESGKPIIGIRTASHGFQNWLEMDKMVFGGNYKGHYKNDITQKAVAVKEAAKHPVLDGVGAIVSRGSLYKTGPVAGDVEVLMNSSSPEGTEPAAWVRKHPGARVFYTSLGAQGDFENATFIRFLTNAVFWAAGREVKHPADPIPPRRPRPEGTLKLKLRSRVETFKGSGVWDAVAIEREIPVARTAIVVCDMWDKHWCDGATQRCEEIAKEMDRVLRAAREKGVAIIHCPSETMPFYLGTPQRSRMRLAAKSVPPKNLDLSDPPLPIDDSDGGCDTAQTPWYQAWSRQSPRIALGEFDGVTDDGREVYNYLKQEGIDHLFVMGVHTNMCILNRTFAIRQMSRWGIGCILVRDLTDTMYNPKRAPYVPHEQGTALVVQHIEKYWGPSIRSEDLVAGLPK